MTVEAALSKLAYLLGKGLDVNEVRRLMPQSIRGELTPQKPFVNNLTGKNENRIKGLFGRLLLLSSKRSDYHDTRLTAVAGEGLSDRDLTSVEDALNPLLVAAAAARPDASLANLLKTLLDGDNEAGKEVQGLGLLNNFSTHSPLHIACLHGIPKNVNLLLQHGASVHLRDVSGHTALYYAVTSHHASKEEKLTMVADLRSAGAHLSQHEKESAHASSHYLRDIQLWQSAGVA